MMQQSSVRLWQSSSQNAQGVGIQCMLQLGVIRVLIRMVMEDTDKFQAITTSHLTLISHQRGSSHYNPSNGIMKPQFNR